MRTGSAARHQPPVPSRVVATLAAAILLCMGAGVVGAASRSSSPEARPRSFQTSARPTTQQGPAVDGAPDGSEAASASAAPPVASSPTTVPPATAQKRAPISRRAATPRAHESDGPVPSTHPVPDGEFISICRYSHSEPDDPIVFFGQPGASHSHDFFGNTSTNAFSTYDTLRLHDSTCLRPGDSAAYWVPTLHADGETVHAKTVNAYYTAGNRHGQNLRAFPPGFKMVTAKGRGVVWECKHGMTVKGAGFPPACPRGTSLVQYIFFPDCWDGQHLDSADHRSHIAFAANGVCPSDHPVPIPQLALETQYPVDGVSKVTLSSGGPETAHADFFNAWDQTVLEGLVRACVNTDRVCGTGS